ncbi:hypothetical protein RB594_001943 [Gaeumannomyces avenae]
MDHQYQPWTPDPASGSESFSRACDQCRSRKIRCDRQTPCANCRTASRNCTTTGLGRRSVVGGQRVLISTQYERKIDRIEERLGAIEELLRRDRQPDRGSAPRRSTPITTEFPIRTVSSVAASSNKTPGSQASSPLEPDLQPAYEGGSSLTAQSTFAGEFFENAVGLTPVHDDGNPRMYDALASLRQIVTMQRDHPSASELGLRGNGQPKSVASGMQNLKMPPMATVLGLLRQLKESGASNILENDLPFIENDEFVEMCRNVYFNADDFTEATFIIVNACLYHIFAEESYATDNASLRQEYQGYEELCQENLEAAFFRLPLCLPATSQNIKALLIGTIHTIGHNCRPSLAWNLITTAARMCQALGYHRQEVMRKEDQQARNLKAVVFWYVYVLENALALRLGYSSVIRSCEVTIPRDIDKTAPPGPWSSLLGLSVKVADIQANVYELLYSPRASAKPRSQIVDCARRLSRELEVVMDDARKARSLITEEFKPTTQYQDSLDLQLIGDEITCYTTLTMITRAIPAPEGSADSFCDECLDAARRVMRMHQACVAASADNLELQVAYIHWSIVLTPFAPFFVLFCQTISTSSAEDLARIRGFADSLLPASRISDQVRKLQRLCHVFCNVATTYLEAKSRQQQQQQQQGHQQQQQHHHLDDQGDQDMMQIGEFDVCLGALGLMQPDASSSAHHHHHQQHQQGTGWPHHPDGGVPLEGQPLDMHHHQQQMGPIDFSLGDWFAGSRDIMGLLDGGMAPFGTPPEGM